MDMPLESGKNESENPELVVSKLDLSRQCLKKIPVNIPIETSPSVTDLHLDHNEIEKLEGLDNFPSVVELSASHNRLVRMGQLCRLHHVVRLDLSYNNIMAIEGLLGMVHLKYLNLSRNKIKVFDRLSANILLEHLDLSENLICSLSNISKLTNLQKLYLNKNQISSLEKTSDYLPSSLSVLTLAGNLIHDLNQITYLTGLSNLRELSVGANPCVEMASSPVFDYRPFVVNWCLGVKVIDGFAVDNIEVLKAEWLYSQGRGRHYRPGQHKELVKYLAEVCPLTSTQNFQTEQERKLRLILSKALHHQRQLQSEQPGKGRTGEADLMTRSLDSSLLDCFKESNEASECFSEASLSRSLHCEPVTKVAPKVVPEKQKPAENPCGPAPLPAASKLLPVPESLISPMMSCPPNLVKGSYNVTPVKTSKPASKSSDETGTTPVGPESISSSKPQTIKCLAQEKRFRQSDPTNEKAEHAAICIQRMWRGYQARNLNPKVVTVYQQLQLHRTNRYIVKLSQDMEATRIVLDNEHKLQLLQMQAINALWKKVVSLQPSDYQQLNDSNLRDLTVTCDRLNSQVKQLQECMQEVLRCVSPSNNSHETATQTEITAVHTPIADAPTQKFLYSRPSSLLLPGPVTQYADDLVGGVLKNTVTAPPAAYQDDDPSQISLDEVPNGGDVTEPPLAYQDEIEVSCLKSSQGEPSKVPEEPVIAAQ